MKTKLSILCIALVVLSVGCTKDEEKKDWSEEIYLLVSHQSVDYYPFGSEKPIKGINTKEEKSNVWISLAENGIEDFSYEEGYEYTLKVLKIHLGNPPMDTSNFRYKLVTIISRNNKSTNLKT